MEADALIARGRLKHQYPHSWRSKKPVIFRNTPQWFIAMDKPLGLAPLVPVPRGERVGVRGSSTLTSLAAPHPNPSPQGGGGPGGARGNRTLRETALQAIERDGVRAGLGPEPAARHDRIAGPTG